MTPKKTKRPGIEVTVVQFFEPQNLPSRLSLRTLTTPLRNAMPGFVTGLSGHNRLNGMMFAGQHAREHNLELVAVDMLVGFQMPLCPTVMSSDALPNHDVLNMSRISKEMTKRLAAYWRQWIVEAEGPSAEHKYDWSLPASFVAREPKYISRLLECEEFRHIQVVTHPVATAFSAGALLATSVRTGYPRINQANSRFHPAMEVVSD
jgi:hypothetical protein